MQRALGIETATSIASVGIVAEDQVVAERSLPMHGSHARTLLPLIDDVLGSAGFALSDLDVVAVSIGPGSFTGLRIGLSVAKGLVLATDLSLAPVPTLSAYAHTIGARSGVVCPVFDARKGEVYGAVFRWRADELECVVAPRAVAPAQFAASLQGPCTLVGDGVDTYAELWRRALGDAAELIPFAALPPSGAMVARLGMRIPALDRAAAAALEPSYCRPSEAELGRTRQGFSASAGVERDASWKN